MKWYHSLKFKNSLFFLAVGSLFVLAMMLFFSSLKEQRLVDRAEAAVTLATHEVVRELLLVQQRNEQIVEDMADIASVQDISSSAIKKLLHVSRENEIVSGGLWFEPYAEKDDEENFSYFYHREDNGTFIEILDYQNHTEISYRDMEYYALARQLKAGETFWTKAYTDPVTKVRMITVVSPVYREGNFVGVASLDIALVQKQKQVFSELINSNERYFLLADRVGELLIYSEELVAIGVTPNSLKNSELDNHYPFSNFLFYHQLSEGNNTLANTLISTSEDFSEDEVKQLAYELEHKDNRHHEQLLFHSKIVMDDPIFHEPTVMAAFYFPHASWHMLIAIPEHVILKDTIAVYDKIMIITAIFALVAALMGYLLIRMSIVKPLQSITNQIRAIELDQDVEIKLNDKSEIGLLAESFNTGMKELNIAREKERRNEALLMQQSKMAAMGEMLDAVAHQWKQPLNALSMYAELIKINYEDGEVDQAYIEQFQEDIETQINHMTDTLGTFRAFFRPTKELHTFDLHQVINDVLLLAKDELIKNTINVEVLEEGKLELFGSENEFKHLLLNIINNAKDAFNDNAVKTRNITVRIIAEQEKPRLEIEDSAGGIPAEVINNIFQAHFTTKEEGKGTGIGLYMSSQIAQKHHAELRVENREKGACFIVTFSDLSFHS